MRKPIITILYLCLGACATIPYPKEIDRSLQLSGVCKSEIAQLRAIDLSTPSPTDGFVKNQLCIAQYACENQNKFDNPAWLDSVLKDFVEAYLQKTNNWNKVINKCEARNAFEPINGLFCQKDMAQYHIFTDLSYAVAKDGCGSDKDWNLLESAIRQCVNDAKYPPIMSQYVSNRVITYRNEVRAHCQIEWGKK